MDKKLLIWTLIVLMLLCTQISSFLEAHLSTHLNSNDPKSRVRRAPGFEIPNNQPVKVIGKMKLIPKQARRSSNNNRLASIGGDEFVYDPVYQPTFGIDETSLEEYKVAGMNLNRIDDDHQSIDISKLNDYDYIYGTKKRPSYIIEESNNDSARDKKFMANTYGNERANEFERNYAQRRQKIGKLREVLIENAGTRSPPTYAKRGCHAGLHYDCDVSDFIKIISNEDVWSGPNSPGK